MVINGNIAKMVYKDHETGFSIFKVRTRDNVPGKNEYGEIVAKGFCPTTSVNFPVTLTGEIDSEGKDYSDIKVDLSMDEYCLINYFKGFSLVGEKKAEKAAKAVSSIMDEKALIEKLTEITDSGTAKDMLLEITEVKKIVKAKEKLSAYKYLDLSSIQRIIHSKEGLDGFIENPYYMGIELRIPVDVCDDLGMKSPTDLNIQRDRYLKGLLSHSAYSQGSTFLTPDETKKEYNTMEKKSPYFKKASSMSAIAGRTGVLFPDKGVGFVLKKISKCEDDVVREILRLLNTSKNLRYNPNIPDIEKRIGITYAYQQKGCFEIARTTGVKIVTGGPGTGKTTTIKGVIMGIQDANPEAVIRLCAPTGRAAQRLSESTGMPACTAHRLLEVSPFGYGEINCKNQYNPIEADIIIVDEVSMLDVEIFAKLLNAIKNGTLVILMGDIDQLISVGPGAVLNDLIQGGLECYMLTEVYRQAKDSNIILNAKLINSGKIEFTYGDDFSYKVCRTEKEVFEESMHDYLKRHKADNFFHSQILTPQHDFETGTRNFNRVLQDEINPYTPGQKFYIYGKTKFRMGDKVLLTNNNYMEGYYNGDIGIIIDILSNGIIINRLGADIILITNENMRDVMLAYGMTIHKSQGSEFPCVILPFTLKVKNMLVKNLPYTGVTRAKEYASIYAQEDALEIAAKQTVSRNTSLGDKLFAALH